MLAHVLSRVFLAKRWGEAFPELLGEGTGGVGIWSMVPFESLRPPLEGSRRGIRRCVGSSGILPTRRPWGLEWSGGVAGVMPRRPSILATRCSNPPRRSPTLSRRLITTVNRLSAMTTIQPTAVIATASMDISFLLPPPTACAPNNDSIISYHDIALIDSNVSRIYPHGSELVIGQLRDCACCGGVPL